MIITGMKHFESVCRKKLCDWYNTNDDMYHTQQRLEADDVYIVWACKTLQNYKCLASTTVSGCLLYTSMLKEWKLLHSEIERNHI